MSAQNCIAIVLASGHGQRLGALTRHYSNPMIHLGGNQRIIDFTLGNCNYSKIDTVGILSQHFISDLQAYIGETYEPEPNHSDIYILPPRNANNHYKGTADAVCRNIEFIDRFCPEYVLILPGYHVYSMDYNKILDFHTETGAAVTVASAQLPSGKASGFRFINAESCGRVREIGEAKLNQAVCPASASMGVYVFNWSLLKRYLLWDSASILTWHDIDWDIIPRMLRSGEAVYTYRFDGYWQDAGTISGIWEANMALLDDPSLFRWPGSGYGTWGEAADATTSFIASGAKLRQSIVSGECSISGMVRHSVLSDRVIIGEGAEITGSVVMPGVYIGDNVKIQNAIVGAGAVIMDGAVIGADNEPDFFVDKICSNGVSLVAPWTYIGRGMRFRSGSHIYKEIMEKFLSCSGIQIEPEPLPEEAASVVYHIPHEPVYQGARAGSQAAQVG